MIPETLLDSVKQLSGALMDAYAIVDADANIVDFNRAFYSLFPRSIARQLKKRRFDEVLALELAGKPLDLAQECMGREMSLRYDEVVGRIDDAETTPLDLIVSAVPLVSPTQELNGAFISLRNVTDEAQVQLKYKTMLEEEAREREALQRRIKDVDAELVEVKDLLARTEEELLVFKKGLLI